MRLIEFVIGAVAVAAFVVAAATLLLLLLEAG